MFDVHSRRNSESIKKPANLGNPKPTGKKTDYLDP